LPLAAQTVSYFLVVSSLMSESQGDLQRFVTRDGDQLFVGEKEFRFVSFNVPNLYLLEDSFQFADPDPWRWPNEFEIRDALESVRQMGGTVVRPYVLSVYREDSDMGDHVFVRGPGEFNEEAYRVLDLVLKIANEKGVRVMIPFVDNWHWQGGRAQYAAFRGKEPEAFWSDEQIINDFEQTVRHTVNRVNTYTGIPYKQDPAIFGWETGNELDPAPMWTRRITALIKQLDSNHLVIDGCSLQGVQQSSLDDPHVDVITTHHYPRPDHTDFRPQILEARKKTKDKKPYFVGEFGFVPTENMEQVLDTVIDEGISGALLWSLRYHRREGGFYWHREPAGGGLYKAYHWPGFDSGDPYEERAVLAMMREKAFKIRGMEPAPRSKPAVPRLLPIDDVGAISWQGSAGASGYDIERATSSEGPWEQIAHNVSDAAVQYRPLFNDTQVEVNESYYYRVIARNEAGTSGVSNLVGPVQAQWRVLVDEGRDLSQVHAYDGTVTPVSQNERRFQEDCHRLEISRGSSIEYRVGNSINRWRIMLFYDGPSPQFEISASSNGEQFSNCELQRTNVEFANSDYAYSNPVLLEGEFSESGKKYLRITLLTEEPSSSQGSTVQLSRVEIRYGGKFDR